MSDSSPLPIATTTRKLKYVKPVIRYVAAYEDPTSDGETVFGESRLYKMYSLAQGRYTHATIEECEAWIDSFFKSNNESAYARQHPEWLTMAVVKCPCFPDHFDPMRTIFGKDEVVS